MKDAWRWNSRRVIQKCKCENCDCEWELWPNVEDSHLEQAQYLTSTVFDASAGNKHCRLSVKCDPLTKTHVQSKHRFRHLMWQESEQVLTRGEGPCLNQQQQLIIVYSCVPWKVTVSTMFSSKHLKFSRIKNSSRLWMMNCSRTSKWANNVFHFLGTSLIRSGLWIFPFPKWQGLFQAEHKSEWQHLTCVDMSSKPGWWWWFCFGIWVQFT